MIDRKHISGENRGDVLVYALSTCGWCRKTKNYLNELGVAYDYIDVDLVDQDDEDFVMTEISKFSKQGSFPTIVINNQDCIVGYNPDRLKELLFND
jgi:glutaredoxin